MDIKTRGKCRQFSLLTWALFMGQFVHPVGGEGMGVNNEGDLHFTRYTFYSIEYMIIWSKIQVIIHPLFKHYSLQKLYHKYLGLITIVLAFQCNFFYCFDDIFGKILYKSDNLFLRRFVSPAYF